MSKMAEMAQTIEELRTAAASINAAADWLYQQFSGVVDIFYDAPVPGVVPFKHDLFSGEVGTVPVLLQEQRVGQVLGPVQ